MRPDHCLMHTTSSRDTIPDTLLKSAYQVGTSTHSFAPQAMLRLVMLELLIEYGDKVYGHSVGWL